MSEITERLTTAIADRYRIERELGAGGMATVYLAHDVKHDRKVALKVLRPELAAVIGAERFLNEIKVTANLQHPHILPLHDSGEADTFLYYVMPYVEGETLREKIDREKQLGVTEAIEVTRSVAAALDYAHRQNVIHRDIKPENILIHDGQALVADFGIALAVSQAGGTRLTETGLSVGTPHYMSPEQAMGDRELDARSDVYSLGAVLYEMLAGDPPYTGSTAQAIVAKVITEKAPPVTVHRDTVPPHVAAAIQKALSKLPADRFHSAAEFADALTKPGAVPTVPRDVPAEAVPAPARAIAIPIPSARAVLPWALLAVAAGVAVWALLRPPPHAQVARFQVGMPEDAGLLTATNGRTIALSPDGGTIVYVGPSRQLFARRLDQLAVRPLPGTRGAHTPFFSPDGAWVGFYASPSLKRVALAGGPPLTIANAPTMRGASWGTDDYIVFAPSIATGLMRVAAAGGPVDTLTRPDQGRGETSHRWPRVLPGGKAVLFTAFTGGNEGSQVAVLLLETGEVRYVVGGVYAWYVATGHIVYATDNGSLLAVPFDLGRLETTGNPVALVEGLVVKGTAVAEFVVSHNGTLVYLEGEAADLALAMVDRSGGQRSIVENLTAALGPRVSPDGRYVALRLTSEGNTDVWIYDLEQNTLSRLTFEGTNDYPSWSPDGRHVFFSSVRDSADRDIYRRAADGSGVAEPVLIRDAAQWEFMVAPGGDRAVFREAGQETGRDIWVLSMDSARETSAYLATSFDERAAVISPGGRWLAYVSNESGQDEVYVRAFPQPSGRWQISTDGGTEPLWSTDGGEIYYRRDEELFAVRVRTDPTFTVGQRDLLFQGPFSGNVHHTNYDVNPATGEFVMLRTAERATTSLVVALNWFQELRERMAK